MSPGWLLYAAATLAASALEAIVVLAGHMRSPLRGVVLAGSLVLMLPTVLLAVVLGGAVSSRLGHSPLLGVASTCVLVILAWGMTSVAIHKLVTIRRER